jgi:hypothetical protein
VGQTNMFFPSVSGLGAAGLQGRSRLLAGVGMRAAGTPRCSRMTRGTTAPSEVA